MKKSAIIRSIVIMTLATLAACSTQSAVDRMASPADKSLALGFAAALCDGSIGKYQDIIDPKLWSESQALFPKIKPYCPTGKTTSRLMGYHFNMMAGPDGAVKRVNMVVMTESPGKWTTTTIATIEKGQKLSIMGWNVNSSPQKPQEIAAIDQWDANVGYLRFGVPAVILLLIAGVVWFYRRAKRLNSGTN